MTKRLNKAERGNYRWTMKSFSEAAYISFIQRYEATCEQKDKLLHRCQAALMRTDITKPEGEGQFEWSTLIRSIWDELEMETGTDQDDTLHVPIVAANEIGWRLAPLAVSMFLPPHPIEFKDNDPNKGRACLNCGFAVPAGMRYAHADWCEPRKVRTVCKDVTRPEDMSPDGTLTLTKQDDGDILVTVKADSGRLSDGSGGIASVEFCLSGGRSPKTLAALNLLMIAMQEDDDER